jgi:hypothetical protein
MRRASPPRWISPLARRSSGGSRPSTRRAGYRVLRPRLRASYGPADSQFRYDIAVDSDTGDPHSQPRAMPIGLGMPERPST